MSAALRRLFGASAIVICAAVVPAWEGKRNSAYRDIAGTLTICYGHTGGDVYPGQTVSDTECQRLLNEDLAAALAVVTHSVVTPMSEPRKAGLASFVFNVGETRFKRSTLLRLVNSNDPAACDQLLRWIYIYDPDTGGYVASEGLLNRRIRERALCRS